MSAKNLCVACEKKDILGIFKCEGCSERFCLKHANEHRNFLQYQLEEIMLEHAKMARTFDENKYQASIFMEQINQWEKMSIEKIQHTAQDIRVELQRLADEEKEQMQEKSMQLRRQLENARICAEYLEDDLTRWRILLEQLIYDFNQLSPSITLQQDPTDSFIPRLIINKMNQSPMMNDSLISSSNDIQFDDQHHLAMHCGLDRTPAYITGTREYATGQHQIRLFIRKKTCAFTLSFNIMSKLMDLSSPTASSEYLTYGWQSDDCVNPSQSCSLTEKLQADLRGRTRFYIKFLIDCDQHMIAYVNEKTKRRKEIHVDVNKCPLPWKLYFYLYDIGDTVRLLSSSSISKMA